MPVHQGFVVEHRGDYRPAFATAADAGFDYVELNMEARFSRGSVDPAAVRGVASDHGLDLAVHLPYSVDVGSPHEHAREGACRELEASLEAAAAFGADTAVFHAHSSVRPSHWETSRVVDAICESAQRLHEHGADCGITVCAENLPGQFVTVSDFPELFARTDAAMCLDTGHAYATGLDGHDQAVFLREHGDRVAHVHLNEARSDGADEHLPVGMGRVNFAPLADAITETDWTGTCTHEVFSFDETFEYARVGKRRFDALLAG